jgi:hypothetical protein
MSTAQSDDRFDKVAQRRLEALQEQPVDATRLARAPRSRLSTLIDEAGFVRATASVRERLEAAFDRAGIDTVPSVTNPNLKPTGWVRFFRRGMAGSFASEEQLFESEHQLERYLVNNPGAIAGYGRLTLLGRQHRLADNRRIDLLYKARGDVHLVVELKAGAPDDGLASQMRRYLSGYEQELRASGIEAEVRGLVISGQPDVDVERDVAELCSDWDVRWMLYRRSFSLHVRTP